jgi:hypothetical protein
VCAPQVGYSKDEEMEEEAAEFEIRKCDHSYKNSDNG